MVLIPNTMKRRLVHLMGIIGALIVFLFGYTMWYSYATNGFLIDDIYNLTLGKSSFSRCESTGSLPKNSLLSNNWAFQLIQNNPLKGGYGIAYSGRNDCVSISGYIYRFGNSQIIIGLGLLSDKNLKTLTVYTLPTTSYTIYKGISYKDRISLTSKDAKDLQFATLKTIVIARRGIFGRPYVIDVTYLDPEGLTSIND